VTSTKGRDNYEGTAERSVKGDRKGKIEKKKPKGMLCKSQVYKKER
jgi:hypothetical protein